MILWVLFLFLPLLEIALFAMIGGEIGIFNTLFLVILMVFAGSLLVRTQGLRTAMAMQEALNRGEMPVREMFDGMCLFVAGVFFIVPGFFSDFLGFLLLIPPLRQGLRSYLARFFIGEPVAATWSAMSRHERREEVVDVEFTRIDDDDKTLLP